MSTFSTNDSTVNSFYLAFYGRPADPAGLKFWSAQLAANNGDMGAIVNFFAASEEAQVRFGTDTVADRITEIYSQLFNRTPDAEGMAFWTNAIEKGNASLADVAMSIQSGAQGSDATLSQLRKQAADAFTAKVEADGSDYSGYASIEAARILVRAVTPDSTSEDLDALVNAAVSFADTATKTPQVVEAIAVNTTLLALFDTARGVSEPVALAKALADTAKAAAGDPVTLESLLRGGGMDKVLKVMPAKATLVDVVEALAKGGLPAAVEVVYPTTPTAPTTPSTPGSTAFKLAFDHVIESALDAHKKDNVTNYSQSDVTFKYTGSNLAAGQHIQASIDGGDHWTQLMVETDPVTKTVTVLGVKLAGQHTNLPSFASPTVTIQESAPQNVTTTITLRVVDAENKPVASFTPFKQDIIFDGHVATPGIKIPTAESQNGFWLGSTQAIST